MYFFLILQKYVSQKVVNAGQNIEPCRQGEGSYKQLQ